MTTTHIPITATITGLTSLKLARVGAVSYILWAVLHLVAAFAILPSALAPLQGMEPSVAHGRIFQSSAAMVVVSVASILIALTMNWRNSRLGYWLQVILVGGLDVAFIVFVLFPGYEPLSQGFLGPLLWLIALGTSTAARFTDHARPTTAALGALALIPATVGATVSASTTRTAELEVVHEMADRPGNVAVSPDGRLFASIHPLEGRRVNLVELLPNGGQRAYPSAAWASPPNERKAEGLTTVIGVEVDADGVLWVLDNGTSGIGAKLVAWDTKAEKLIRTWPLDAAAVDNSFMQDLAIDPQQRKVYIADMAGATPDHPSRPAFVVLDLATGNVSRRLEAHPLLQGEAETSFVAGGSQILNPSATPSGEPVDRVPGLNPITIDPAGQWVYFGAMRGTSVFRIATADLGDATLTDEQLAERIQRHGPKPVSDGIGIDTAGNVYITDLPGSAIGVLKPDGTYEQLIVDPNMLPWPDGMSYGPDGFFYVTVNQLHRHPWLNAGADHSMPPYRIVRFRPLAPSALGR
ncbi:MAG: L-dopachrome tautomerase-related protein [Planctomycetota bacterium]